MQKLNCKIGDLAIVVNAEQARNVAGYIVEVLGPQTSVPFELSGPGHVRQVRSISGRRTLSCRYNSNGRVVQHSAGPVPDCRLRAIPGLAGGGEAQDDTGLLNPAARRKHN